MAVLRTLVLQGTARQSSVNQKRTAGGFSRLVKENEDVFRRYFGIHLFPGSFNVDVANPPDLQRQMDDGLLPSDFVIPRTELGGMPEYIGDGQAWCCEISGPKVTRRFDSWIFRRIGSRVPRGVLEILAPIKIVDEFAIVHGDPMEIVMHLGR